MRLSPDDGATPAPRRSGDVVAMRNAYPKGLYFDGDVDMPILDIRRYLEEKLDMHNSHQSFAIRQRMLDHDGDASNQVIWFWGQNGGDRLMLPQAFQVMDQWLANQRAYPWRGVARNKPARRRGWLLHGHRADDCLRPARMGWDHRPPPSRRVHAHVPLALDVAHRGGPLRGGVYKCALQSVNRAIATGSTAPGTRARPTAPGSSGSSRPACATTRARTWGRP